MLSETLQRPKPGETEEDVLALQEEFLRSRYLPSATLVKANDENLRYKGIGDIFYLLCKTLPFYVCTYNVNSTCTISRLTIVSPEAKKKGSR